MTETVAPVSSAGINTELAMRRTGMAFQRTRMAADRTLMAVIRTSLSLISFGFTIYQIFKKLRDVGVLRATVDARRFGLTLVLLGVAMLILGIIYHLLFMRGLRLHRNEMKTAGLIHAQSGFPASLTLITAVLLLIVGLVAAISILSQNAPYS